jgi:cell fate regulator YaaT (PSP1 superfamily)
MRIGLVRLREGGQLMAYQLTGAINVHDYILVEADRGVDYGEVIEINEVDLPPKGDGKDRPAKSIVRKLSPEDLKKIKANEKEAKDAMRLCARKVREYKLAMKLVDSEYSFDKKKIIFYFTSEGRVDFRELVKELAKIFKIRIEMRQIGVRDEARLFGGVGPCGQKLCCMRFLKSFEPVSMKMAKLQRLPLSSGKISGICGRLMCCLFYEYKNYRELSKGLPKEGQTFGTAQGKGKVISVNVLKRLAYVELEDGRIEKVFFKDNA